MEIIYLVVVISKEVINMAMGTERRGFASMDPEKRREIARKGGKAAHQKGTAHEFSPEEAREAGRKGGQRSHGGRSSSDEME